MSVCTLVSKLCNLFCQNLRQTCILGLNMDAKKYFEQNLKINTYFRKINQKSTYFYFFLQKNASHDKKIVLKVGSLDLYGVVCNPFHTNVPCTFFNMSQVYSSSVKTRNHLL